MGLGPSRLTYDMPPPPPMSPSDDDLDLSLSGKMLSERIQDPEGYDMCHKVAIKEGILAATCAMSLTGLAIIGAKRKLTRFTTLQALLSYSPGVVFLVSSAGMASCAFFTEITMHDCTFQRGIFLMEYYKRIGHGELYDEDRPDRQKTTNWNVKRKPQRLTTESQE